MWTVLNVVRLLLFFYAFITCIWTCYSLPCVVQDMNFRKPLTRYTAEQVREMGWKYYNSEIHEASFVMPQFAQQVSCAVSLRITSWESFQQ